MSGPGGYNPFQAEHAQCNFCGKMVRGAHKDKVFEDHNVYAADKERVYTRDEAEAVGIPHNVSGTACPDCFQDQKEKMRKSAEGRRNNPVGHRDEIRAQRRAKQEEYARQLAERRRYEAEQKAIAEGNREAKEQSAQHARDARAAERARKAYKERGRQSAAGVEGLPGGEEQAQG